MATFQKQPPPEWTELLRLLAETGSKTDAVIALLEQIEQNTQKGGKK